MHIEKQNNGPQKGCHIRVLTIETREVKEEKISDSPTVLASRSTFQRVVSLDDVTSLYNRIQEMFEVLSDGRLDLHEEHQASFEAFMITKKQFEDRMQLQSVWSGDKTKEVVRQIGADLIKWHGYAGNPDLLPGEREWFSSFIKGDKEARRQHDAKIEWHNLSVNERLEFPRFQDLRGRQAANARSTFCKWVFEQIESVQEPRRLTNRPSTDRRGAKYKKWMDSANWIGTPAACRTFPNCVCE